jgi:hypothetical protein
MSALNDAVRNQLKKILSSRQFQSSELQRQFLAFVVEKTLNGSGDEIKEYVIGAEAFGRGQGFDPRLDSVVRVVARRVRERLAEYYQTEGRDDPVLIVLAVVLQVSNADKFVAERLSCVLRLPSGKGCR